MFPLCASGEALLRADPDAGPALGQGLDGTVRSTVQPAYRLVEGVSDGVYDFVRVRLIGSFLAQSLTRNLRAAPGQDSALLFDKNLREKEARFLQRARETYPAWSDAAGPSDAARLREWQSWAADEQRSVAVDALRDTLLQRYGLELFGRSAQAYAGDRRNWDPGLLTMAGLIGGGLLYVNGMHAAAGLGDWNLAMDLRSGARLQQALRDGAPARGLARLELGYKDKPLTVASEWGADGRRLRSQSLGLMYRLRY
jgi:hypothetical protein